MPNKAALSSEYYDVLIVGSGLSGVAAGHYIKRRFPGMSFLIVDALDATGGTWVTHKFPGVRSDSDLYTYSYEFKPWKGNILATAQEIRNYLGEVIDEDGLASHIRHKTKIQAAEWSSQSKSWRVQGSRTDTRKSVEFTAGFLWTCTGYYDHTKGYMPTWPGIDEYLGKLVHSQVWPEDLDCRGKSVIVVGSGATAATLVPAIADECKQVTLLQRSPTYFYDIYKATELTDLLRKMKINEDWIYEIQRQQIFQDEAEFIRRTREEPQKVKDELIAWVATFLSKDQVEAHFTPKYLPWEQRVAVVPAGDLFKSIQQGKAKVITDEIEKFVSHGILLKSGKIIKADIIVAATGLNLHPLGGIQFVVDGKPLALSDTITYRGFMFTGLPNLVWTFGYVRESYTMRIDLISSLVCRLFEYMKHNSFKMVSVALRPEDKNMSLSSFFENANFTPGYVKRGQHLFPKAGSKPEWQHAHDYFVEREIFPKLDLSSREFIYGK